VERFRAAPDRKAKERVARRLIEDSRSEDEDIRALAVWAMLALSDIHDEEFGPPSTLSGALGLST